MATRTAVTGAGVMGRQHLRALAAIPQAHVVALVDPADGPREETAREFGVAAAYADVRTMLREQSPDYVVVSSPPLFHAEQTVAAFEAGAHVLCEKPLCMSVAEAEAMIGAAVRSGRLFSVGYHHRQRPRYRAMRRFVAEGRLGRVYHTRVWGGQVMSYPWGRFHHRKEFSLGGVVAATTIHLLDAAMWVVGARDPVTVSASTFRRIDKMRDPPVAFEGTPADVSVEDFAHAHVRFGDGSSMSVEGNWLDHPGTRTLGFEVHGVLGTIRDDAGAVELERGGEIEEEPLEFPEEPGNLYQAEHEEFLAAIAGRGEPLVRFWEALAMQKILTGIYESAEAGAEVRLD